MRREVQYQADNILSSIESRSADVFSAVQSACDYLGGNLCEVRWAIERQTPVSQQILQVLLSSLDSTSRQYWEQGVKCYDCAEYDIAKERFSRALDANATNYFAYQYLGLIAVHEEKAPLAIRNFELARKFSENNLHRALALSHLARTYNAIDEVPKAVQNSAAAAAVAPEHGKFWYETAIYYVRLKTDEDAEKAQICLRRAIANDWMYWSIAITDANLEPIRPQVQKFLGEMRDEQRDIARRTLEQLRIAIRSLQSMGINSGFVEAVKTLDDCQSLFREGTVFAYRNLVQAALDSERKVWEMGIEVLDGAIKTNRSELSRCGLAQREEVEKVQSQIRFLEAKASQKAKSYNLDSRHFVLIFVGLFAVSFSYLHLLLNGVHTDWKVWGAALGIGVIIAVLPFIMRFLTATFPAAMIRWDIPDLKRKLDLARSTSAARLVRERAALDPELDRLKRNKMDCRSALHRLNSTLDPSQSN